MGFGCWLETSSDKDHGGQGWEFSKCLWAPTHKNGKNYPSAFWKTMEQTNIGDLVLHLRKSNNIFKFVGFSTVSSPCNVTEDRPPLVGKWGHASSFYKVELEDHMEIDPVDLDVFLNTHQTQIKKDIHESRSEGIKVGFVYQNSKLRALEGAYFSVMPDSMLRLLLNEIDRKSNMTYGLTTITKASQTLSYIKTRIGQYAFSNNVKNNFDNVCCFPSCDVSDRRFLIGGHIDRWSDNEESRGDVSNGICLCGTHDIAFEKGFFTIEDGKVVVIREKMDTEWLIDNILPLNNRLIKRSKIPIKEEFIKAHQSRVGYKDQ